MRPRARDVVLVLGMASVAAGCLQKDTTHTLYLSPDGAVAWVAEDANVYSDENDPGQRAAEEQAFIGPALLGSHPAARGLQALRPDTLVRTTVVREERPFHVITEARFSRAEGMLERLFTESGIKARVTLTQEDGHSALRMHFDFTRPPDHRDNPAAALLQDLEHFAFVLTAGRFIAGGGFDVPDRTRAVISSEWMTGVEQAIEARRSIDLVLTWQPDAP